MAFLHVYLLSCLLRQFNYPLKWKGQRCLFFSMTLETLVWGGCRSLCCLVHASVVFTKVVLLQRRLGMQSSCPTLDALCFYGDAGCKRPGPDWAEPNQGQQNAERK